MEYKKTNLLQLANTVFKKIQKEKLLNSQDNLLITFSGGQDSALCLLILFVLKKRTNFAWNRRKIVDFSKPYQTQGALRKHTQKPSCYKSSLCYAKTKLLGCRRTNCSFVDIAYRQSYNWYVPRCNRFNLVCTRLLERSLFSMSGFHFFSKPNAGCLPLTPINGFQKRDTQNLGFSEKKIVYNHLYNVPVTNYTLLWCNHFWQRQAFSTMEHVSKLVFCKGYAIHLFAPVRTVLSEQGARNWRHKVMQRSSLFLAPKKCNCNSIELYYNLVSIYHTRSARKDTKAHAKKLLMPCLQKRSFCTHNFVVQQKQSLCKSFAFASTALLCKNKVFAYKSEAFVAQRSCACKGKNKLQLQKNQGVTQKNSKAQTMFGEGARTKHSLVDIACLQSYVAHVSQQFYTHKLSAENELSFLHQVKRSQEPNHWGLRGYALNTQFLPEQLCVQGHTKSDRAETILFNVIKGAGMNGISTLQRKQTFYSDPHLNTMFYPISSDFFKEIRIVSLHSQNDLKKKTVSTNRSSLALFTKAKLMLAKTKFLQGVQKRSFCKHSTTFALLNVLQQSFVLLRFLNTTQFGYKSVNPKTRRYSNQSKSNVFCKDSHMKPFYYQLKYRTRKI